MANKLGWILGADCPHCDKFTPALPTTSASCTCEMHCPCGVIFLTRNTYRRRALDVAPEQRAHVEQVICSTRPEQANC